MSPALISEARRMGFATIQWDVDPRQLVAPEHRRDLRRHRRTCSPGAIVIQHDGGGNRSETLAALPREIAALRRRGYRFVRVTQMLGYGLLYK